MSESIWDLSLRSALEQTASPNPTPGGGSIAPVSSALGLGLVLMALEVTRRKQPSAELEQAVARGQALLSDLAGFADRDVAVFQAYMAALGLPRATEAEQALRATAREQAVLDAARTPLLAAESGLRALGYAESVAGLVQKNVWSDLLAGADLLFGGLKAVLRTVDINLPALREPAMRTAFAERAAQLEQEAAEIYARICTGPAA
jgi:formiminotetrahydrofolate cyclodeaminase